MGNFLEIYMVIVMMFTAVMMLVLEIIDSKREKEAKKAQEEVKQKWKEERLI